MEGDLDVCLARAREYLNVTLSPIPCAGECREVFCGLRGVFLRRVFWKAAEFEGDYFVVLPRLVSVGQKKLFYYMFSFF